MSKLSKLIADPQLFLNDAVAKRIQSSTILASFKNSGLIPHSVLNLLDVRIGKTAVKKIVEKPASKKPEEISTIPKKAVPTLVDERLDFCSYSLLTEQLDESMLLDQKTNFVFINMRSMLKKHVTTYFNESHSEVFFLDIMKEDFSSGLGLKKVEEFFLKNQEKVSSLYFSYFLGFTEKKVVFILLEQQGLIFELVTRILKNLGFSVVLWPQNTLYGSNLPDSNLGKYFDLFVSQDGSVKAEIDRNEMQGASFDFLNKKVLSDIQKEKILSFFNVEPEQKKVALSLECPVIYSVAKFRNHLELVLNNILEESSGFDGFKFFIVGRDTINILSPELYERLSLSDVFILVEKYPKIIDDYALPEICDVVISADVSLLAKASYCGATAILMNSMSFSAVSVSQLDRLIVISPNQEEKKEKGVVAILLGEAVKKKLSDSSGFSEDMTENFRKLISSFSEIECNEVALRSKIAQKQSLLPVGPVCASEFGKNALDTTNLYLAKMLGVTTIVQSNPKLNNIEQLARVDFFVQWGIKPTPTKKWQDQVRRSLFKPLIILEDGFVRSIDIGLSGSAGLSIILDDITSYYDSTRVSRLEENLQNGREISDLELKKSEKLIEKIVSNKISKYNHAPVLPLKIGHADRPKILLIDQRYGDQSVESGLGSPQLFDSMLRDAIRDYPHHDILIKQHPDATLGGKSSYFSAEKMEFSKYTDNIFLINFDVNPYCLFDLVDEVFVCTSGMGFEALLAGKKVRCYGVPFYSGWGLTSDQQPLARRSRKRSLQEVFYFSYVDASLYFSPIKDARCELDELIDYIVSVRGW